MAIKERKQITGTTAQIQAYEGHEGQIVWDKDKKTLVGMSGTAGTNYPLASQTYVDTQFLPLTGGKLTGTLNLALGGQLYQYKDTSNGYGYLVLTSKEGGGLNSCSLFLANTDSPDKGSMILRYTDGSGNNRDLYLQGESGEIYWNGRTVETVSGSGSNYIRYESGLQICWGRVGIPSGQVNTTVTLPVPYKDSESYRANGSYPDVLNTTVAATIEIDNGTHFRIAVTSVQGRYDWYRAVDWTAIGRWK